MTYDIQNGILRGVFAVPNEIVDKHLRLCGALPLKVLLVLLRHGRHMEVAELAVLLGQSQPDIQDAVNGWVHLGVLAELDSQAPDTHAAESQSTAKNTAETQPQPKPNAAPSPAAAHLPRPGGSRPRLTTQEINEMAKSDINIAQLLQEAQQLLGKPLTPVATDTLMGLYGYYGLSADLILILIQYCLSIGKDSMRYLEKVAADWIEKGIDSHEKAEEELHRRARINKAEAKVKSLFGIHDRSLVSSESRYIQRWVEELGLDYPLIQLAFERAVEMKGKLSFPYINGILSNWHGKGIQTTRQAMQEIQQPPRPAKSAAPEASYRMEDLENLINYGDIQK